jgi:gluconolactonase
VIQTYQSVLGTLNIDKEDEDKTLPLGTLYSFDAKRQLKGQVRQVRLTNGLAFNDKTKKMFYIDTLKGSVDQFDFDVTNGVISTMASLMGSNDWTMCFS